LTRIIRGVEPILCLRASAKATTEGTPLLFWHALRGEFRSIAFRIVRRAWQIAHVAGVVAILEAHVQGREVRHLGKRAARTSTRPSTSPAQSRGARGKTSRGALEDRASRGALEDRDLHSLEVDICLHLDLTFSLCKTEAEVTPLTAWLFGILALHECQSLVKDRRERREEGERARILARREDISGLLPGGSQAQDLCAAWWLWCGGW
jgi:hypothetical protein